MWEKISKEMQLPWRAAEAMHWQIGEVEMAQRANVPVFHLAGQQTSQAGAMSERSSSHSPSCGIVPPSTMAYSQTHNHTLPAIIAPQAQPVSPVEARVRSNSDESTTNGPPHLRQRADSARSVQNAATANRTILPPVGEIAGHYGPMRYTLPPVVTSPAR